MMPRLEAVTRRWFLAPKNGRDDHCKLKTPQQISLSASEYGLRVTRGSADLMTASCEIGQHRGVETHEDRRLGGHGRG
ncbi:hypothetical protein ACFPRL_27530 [Pseudoclavibacter helvolus]